MYSAADKTRVIRTYSLILLTVWWLAIIDRSGTVIFMEWRYKADCEFYQKLYSRIVGLKVTECIEKGGSDVLG